MKLVLKMTCEVPDDTQVEHLGKALRTTVEAFDGRVEKIAMEPTTNTANTAPAIEPVLEGVSQ